MSSGSRSGSSSTTRAGLRPAASKSRTSLTRTRSPRTHGRPPHCSGSTVIRFAISVIALPSRDFPRMAFCLAARLPPSVLAKFCSTNARSVPTSQRKSSALATIHPALAGVFSSRLRFGVARWPSSPTPSARSSRPARAADTRGPRFRARGASRCRRGGCRSRCRAAAGASA